jgi:D-alanyl-D-alanine carboxypeptidase (penicillin-binding protein 5/6)
MRKSLSVAGICAIVIVVFVGTITPAFGLNTVSKSPYLGAVVIDADTGRVIFEDQADAKGYPASMIKLMNLLVILDAVKAGRISLSDPVTISAGVSRMGGSQVYLKEKEVFPVDELIYAMMVQSANDAALALAEHYAGGMEGFVDLMNKKAMEIGMKNSEFHSVHGLPPGKNQQPDVTTARDMALLCRELLKYPEALKYTSTQLREFRPDAPEPFIMRTHNHLLRDFEGCDGFKTGYFNAAGFSIAATAKKNNVRAIAVVMGSPASKERDKHARALLSKGLMDLLQNQPATPPPAPAVVEKESVAEKESAVEEESAAEEAEADAPETETDYVKIPRNIFNIAITLNAVVIVLLAASLYIGRSRRKDRLR